MSLEGPFERELAAAKTGDERAWTALYDELAPAVHGYLRLRGAADAEDMVGEVFLQLARNISRFEGDWPAFRSWAFLVTHHRLIDSRRRHGRRREQPDDGVMLRVVDDREDVEEAALAAPEHSWVADALAHLNPDQRDVVTLRVLGGLSVDDTARAIGKRPGAVRVIQHRALNALRERLTVQDVTE